MSKKRGNLLLVIAALILVVVALYSGLRILESTVLHNEEESVETVPSKTITEEGVAYFPRQDITVFLVMGIDETGPVKDSMSYNNTGESDVVLVAIFDNSEEIVHVLALNRDSMVEMPVLGLGGKRAGTRVAQLALAHTYGSGLKDSCENTKETVSNLLGGIYIDYYLSMNMDAIAILNDAVGGVRVTVTEDFSDVDPSIQMGEMVLKGQQALTYVQVRRNVGAQMNISRMERQKNYMQGFVEALHAKTDISILDTFEKISPYTVTDCSVNTLSTLVDMLMTYEMGQIITPQGENRQGEVYMEYYIDEEALDALVLELFYAVK